MDDAPMVILASIVGAGLGAMFFGGLWWTLGKAMTSRQPALWFASSLLLRMSLTLLGFYLVSGDRWQRMVACLLGFAVARVAITWLLRPRPGPSQKVSHASQS